MFKTRTYIRNLSKLKICILNSKSDHKNAHSHGKSVCVCPLLDVCDKRRPVNLVNPVPVNKTMLKSKKSHAVK